jgi:hypothetical protein
VEVVFVFLLPRDETPFTIFSSGSPRTAANAMREEVRRISSLDSTLQNAA